MEYPAPTLQQRIAIWEHAFARTAFLDAAEWAKYLRATPGIPYEVRRAVVAAIIISYARPFTRSRVPAEGKKKSWEQKLGPMDAILPPVKLKETHATMLTGRDKLIGHKDALAAEGDTRTPNVVLLKVTTPTGFEVGTVGVYDVDDKILAEVGELCEFYISHCAAELGKLVFPHSPHFKSLVAGGWYEMSMEPQPTEWLTPAKMKVRAP